MIANELHYSQSSIIMSEDNTIYKEITIINHNTSLDSVPSDAIYMRVLNCKYTINNDVILDHVRAYPNSKNKFCKVRLSNYNNYIDGMGIFVSLVHHNGKLVVLLFNPAGDDNDIISSKDSVDDIISLITLLFNKVFNKPVLSTREIWMSKNHTGINTYSWPHTKRLLEMATAPINSPSVINIALN